MYTMNRTLWERPEEFAGLSSRNRILLAARRLFSAQGYENTSTTAIARLAGTSESQLIKHFGSKEGLLQAIFEEAWERIHERLDRMALGKLPPAEKLRQLINAVMNFVEKDKELRVLTLFETRRLRSEGNKVFLSRGFIRYVHRLDESIQDLRAAGRLREGLHPEALRSALMGALEGLSRDRLLAKRVQYPARYTLEQAQATFNTILDSFLLQASAIAAAETDLPASGDL